MLKMGGNWQTALAQLAAAHAKAAEALRRAGEGGADGGMMKRLGDVDAKQNIQAFATDGAASGKPWPELTAGEGNMKGYVAWKGRNWPNRGMNVWRGDTRDSLTKAGAPDRIVRQRGKTLEFGTSAKLAAKMQTGESYGDWQVVYLKEKSPVFPKGSRKGKDGRKRYKGRVARGRNWFTFLFKSIPARPVVRKSPAQVDGMKREIAREMVRLMAGATSGPLSRYLRERAGSMPRWNA